MRHLAFATMALIGAWWGAPRESEAACFLCSCSIVASNVAFGDFQPLDNARLDGAGAVTVTCGPIGLLASYDVFLSPGGSGASTARRMSNGAYTLDYNLFTTAGRNTIWGDGAGVTGFVSDAWLISLGATSRTHTIHGRIPAQPLARPGAYTDTIIARVEW